MKSEATFRLESILQGPWSKKASAYENFIADLSGKTGIDRKMNMVLRPHWEEEDGITSKKELVIRDSFDEALSELQLLELAVETGYLHLDDIKDIAKKRMQQLLISEAAKKYLVLYDFVGVRFLADRIGVDLGLGKVVPPMPNEAAAVRYSVFLSQHMLWYEDEGLDDFLGLMDDYFYYEDEQKLFLSYLRTNRVNTDDEEMQEYLEDLKSGMFHFIILLSDLFGVLEEKEIPFFGIFYSYWMAKFFGYDLTKRGYVKKRSQTDWSSYIDKMNKPVLNNDDDYNAKDLNLIKKTILSRVEVIRNAWDLTRHFIQLQINVDEEAGCRL